VEAIGTEAIIVTLFNMLSLVCCQVDAEALALGDIAWLAVKGGFAPGTDFLFMTTHAWLLYLVTNLGSFF
jgi:hypothetical protein